MRKIKYSTKMIVGGILLIGLSLSMVLFVAAIFTAKSIPSWMDGIGKISFYFFWLPGIVGLPCFVWGILIRGDKKRDA